MRFLGILLAALSLPLAIFAAESGDSVIVIYNSKSADSKSVATHYASARHVPSTQLFGFDLPEVETITRADFTNLLEKPLLERLQSQGLLVFDSLTSSNGLPGKFLSSKIRYAVVCYGVPVRVEEDPMLVEPATANAPAPFHRNGAAVDAELTLLPSLGKFHLTGPLRNPFYGATNADLLYPRNGLLLVGRLDGPGAEIARGLVDKAMQAEEDGLWGRAYFDLRGVTNGSSYHLGDEWIAEAARITTAYGFDTIIDTNEATFPGNFPMSQIALYAGWSDTQVSGPFLQPHVEFMPGAFAYHLYSYSANPLRVSNATNRPWCATLLAEGAAATMGCVDEPYLEATPNIGLFFARWEGMGFSFGEAALVCQQALSWQTTVLGDPLYRPFGKIPKAQHEELLSKRSPLAAWSFVRIGNIQREMGISLKDTISYLAQQSLTERSAVLSEKLGDLYLEAGDALNAFHAYERALKLKPTPDQRLRLAKSLEAARLASARR